MIQAANGLVLDIAGGEQGGDNQLWKLEEGRLVNKTGMVADVMGANTEEEAEVVGWEKHDGENQKWSIKDKCIHSELTDMVMDLKGGVMEAGTEVHLS